MIFLLFFFPSFLLRSGNAGCSGHYCLQTLPFVSVRFFFIELYFKVKLFEVSDFTGFQLRLCVLIQIPQIQKKLFGPYFIGRLFSIPCLLPISFHTKLLRASIALGPVKKPNARLLKCSEFGFQKNKVFRDAYRAHGILFL